MHTPLHVRPSVTEHWLDALEPWLIWDDDAGVCLSDQALEPVPTLLLSRDLPARHLDAGFAGVIEPDSDPDRVLAALSAIAAGLTVTENRRQEERPEITAREMEVLELLGQGFSNREIGAELGISSHTAKFHVVALLEKLDATSRTEAAVRAARMFII